MVQDGSFVDVVGGGGRGGGSGWGGGVEGKSVFGIDALVDFNDLRSEGFRGEEDFLVVGDFAEGAVV